MLFRSQCCTCHPGCVAVPGRASNSIEDRRCVTDYYWRGDFGFRQVVMLYEHLGKFWVQIVSVETDIRLLHATDNCVSFELDTDLL